jgi:hypothetical protein
MRFVRIEDEIQSRFERTAVAGRKETAVICRGGQKDRWKNGEIVLAPFRNLPRKLNPGGSLERVVIRRRKRRRASPFCSVLLSVLVLYIHEIVANSSRAQRD